MTNPPRYLRFVRTLALGALVATTGCGGGESAELDSGARADAGTDDASTRADGSMADASRADASFDGGGSSIDASTNAGPPDAQWVTVDGPLHPPDLARRA